MPYLLDPEKLKEVLKPMGIKTRGTYMSKAIQDILNGSKAYVWVKNTTAKGKKKAPKEYSWEFEEFWKCYHPMRKAAKRKAWDSFYNGAEDQGELLRACLQTLSWQRNTPAWKDDEGKYFRLATTWLNQCGWEDEDPDQGRGWETYINSEGEEKTRPRTC